jgi:hypothetical protein
LRRHRPSASVRRPYDRCVRLFVLGVIVGGLIVAAGSGKLRDAFGAGQAASATSAPSIVTTAAPASGVAAQVTSVDGALAQAKASGKAVPVTLTFSERDLTTSAEAYFPQTVSGAMLSDPVVHLRSGQIVLDMAAQVTIVRTTAEAIATVTVRAGRPAAAVTSATLAGAALPQSTSDQVAAQLNDALGAGLPAKFVVSSITISTGVMTVNGVANP